MCVFKKHKLEIFPKKMDMNCQIKIATRKQNEQKIKTIFDNLFEVETKKIDS